MRIVNHRIACRFRCTLIAIGDLVSADPEARAIAGIPHGGDDLDVLAHPCLGALDRHKPEQ